jgi:hypothetical protein
VGVADDDPDVGDPGVPDGLDPVEQDGLVGDGDELLGAGERDRTQASALASAQDEGLDVLPPRTCTTDRSTTKYSDT